MRKLIDEKDEDFYYDDITDRQTRLVVKLLSRLKNLKLLDDRKEGSPVNHTCQGLPINHTCHTCHLGCETRS